MRCQTSSRSMESAHLFQKRSSRLIQDSKYLLPLLQVRKHANTAESFPSDHHRLPGSWKNHLAKPHSDLSTRQEDCCHTERLVLPTPIPPFAFHSANLISPPPEFGNTADIEKSLTVSQPSGATATEWISLANGCICCSVKDSGVAALESLAEREGDFDYILLETTGVADPGNIAPMFWLDEGLGSSIYLDSIVTVVDAKNILKSLDEPTPDELPPELSTDDIHHTHSGPLLTTAHLQISHADVLILNKTDLISASHLETVTGRLQSINSLAHLHLTTHAVIPPEDLSGTILDLHAYSTFPATSPPPSTFTSKGHSHLDPSISTATLSIPAFDPQKLYLLQSWLQSILWSDDDEYSSTGPSLPPDANLKPEIHRTKGWIPLLRSNTADDADEDGALIIQGVREIFDLISVPVSKMSLEDRERAGSGQGGKIVFIGRYLENLPNFGT